MHRKFTFGEVCIQHVGPTQRDAAKLAQQHGWSRSIARFLLAVAVGLVAVSAVTAAGFDRLPKITTQPKSVTAAPGGKVFLFVRAYGAGQLTFAWLRNGVPLDGAEEPVLRLASLSAGDEGDYRVVISNPYGRATSEVARVTLATGFVPAVVSANAVGYVNSTLPPGFSLLVNPLSQAGGGPETVGRLAILPDGVTLHHAGTNGFTANGTLGGWREPNELMAFGDAFYVYNPYPIPFTFIFVGEVVEGNLRQSLPEGHSLAASLLPQAGLVSTELMMPARAGEVVWQWDKQAQNFSKYTVGTGGWVPSEPVIPVGEAFVVRKVVSEVWSRIFYVNLGGGFGGAFLTRPAITATDGQLHFFTYNINAGLGRMENVGSEFFGQLYVGLSGGEAALAPVGVPVRFLDGEHRGYVNGGIVGTPGLPGGMNVQVQLRLWHNSGGPSYEAALAAGAFTAKSEIVPARTQAALLENRPGLPPLPVNTFPSQLLSQLPHFVTQPTNLTVIAGQDITLASSGAGAGPLHYQWRRNGQIILDAAGPVLHLPNVQPSDAGDYTVSVSNSLCSVSSTNARLTVYPPLQVLSHPTGTTSVAGAIARFSVNATGAPPLAYQWRSSASDSRLAALLSTATNSSLEISNVVPTMEGDYWVEIRSPSENIASAHAQLTVTNLLHLALNTPAWRYWIGGDTPWRAEAAAGAIAGPLSWNSMAWMETQVDGPGVLTFKWANTARYLDSALLFLVDGDAVAARYDAPGWGDVTIPLAAGTHRLKWKIQNLSGEAPPTARVGQLQVHPGVAPTIVQTSSNLWFMPGVTELQVVASGDGSLSYQWYAGSDAIEGATGNTLDILTEPPAHGAAYSVMVSNFFGAVMTGSMMLRPRPQLRVEQATNGTLRLVWPGEASQFVLEHKVPMSTQPWSPLTQPVVRTGEDCVVSLPWKPGVSRCFRLRLP